MAEDSDEVKIEINAPPKAIEIQADELVNQSNENQQVASEKATDQTAMLTGGITQMTDANILQASPENVKFVMGPNGQLIAMHKPPFEWKDCSKLHQRIIQKIEVQRKKITPEPS